MWLFELLLLAGTVGIMIGGGFALYERAPKPTIITKNESK